MSEKRRYQPGSCAKIRELLTADPTLSPARLAKMGFSYETARHIRRQMGLEASRYGMTYARVREALARNPQATQAEIARLCGCNQSTVHKVVAATGGERSKAELARDICDRPSPRAIRALASATDGELALIRKWNPRLIGEAQAMGVLK